MDTHSARQFAKHLLAEHGLIDRGWSFAFNRRKRSLGLCNHAIQRIELSSLFVAQNDEAAVRDTLLHEIAHALAGHRAGHGSAWVDACRSLGARPKRTCSTAVMPRGDFRAQCPACGKEHDRHRKPMRGRKYYCLACGSRRGKLRFVRGGDILVATG